MPKLAFLTKILGDSNEKELKRISGQLAEINALSEEIARLSDADLAAESEGFKQRIAGGESLDEILPEAFAVVREMAHRRVGERPYDVQLIGGIVLHEGRIAEMKTGEGKTLTGVAPVYLNALEGRGAHIVTVNDYLARRDAVWYGPVYGSLGLTVGVIQNNGISFVFDPDHEPEEEGAGGYSRLRPSTRAEAYAADVTYGTNNEYGFDYLRDNMVTDTSRKSQRGLRFALVDEVDNILIDEARTPLIISGQAEEATSTYAQFARAVRGLKEELDYAVDHKAKHIALTEEGITKVERALGVDNIFGGDPRLARHLEASLDAEYLKRADRDYVVRDGEIVIVDEFTGRMMPGRRWSHGIHQAVEAKEGVKVQRESITHATITFQNLFRLYDKLAGMTGTAETEAEEFSKIYNLDVVAIPTHRPMVRQDDSDVVYINETAKFNAVAAEVERMHAEGRPVLVGTTSIEKSEYLGELLRRRGIPHEVLNAKQHEREARIVQQAGEQGSVVIATNMAGRGTDIKLGQGVADIGGLHVIGTERHESRRIDNQLRGRAGRQGDPGSSRFFVSFGDDIMKRFAPDWVPGMMQKMGMTDDMPLESRMVTRAIEQAQTKVEGHNFDVRKRLVDFDDVINSQRTVIYEERNKILDGSNTRENVLNLLEEHIEAVYASVSEGGDIDYEMLHAEMTDVLPGDDVPSIEEMEDLGEDLLDELVVRAEDRYEQMEQLVGEENMRRVESWLLLESFDYHWREHLTAVEELRQSIGLQAYAQVDPLVAFKREGYDMFVQLQEHIRRQVARTVFRVRIKEIPQPAEPQQTVAQHPSAASEDGATAPAPRAEPVLAGSGAARSPAPAAGGRKVGRNEPCYCGSGLKYKKCHGKVA